MAVTIKGFSADWSVPAGAQEKLRALFSTKMPQAINTKDLGAHGANTVDNAAFLSAMTTALLGRRVSPNNLATDPLGTYTIELPAGDFRITDLQGLMGAEGTGVKVRGLRFKGAGSDLTQVIFDPATAGPLIYNQFWQNVGFEGITFSTTVAGSTFMHSVATAGSAVQDYTFTDVAWYGPWKYVFNLEGTNNNCEFKFYHCKTSRMVDDGAWMYSGSNGSDQFLNYWFYACKHQSTGAPLIDMAKGGHVHIFGLDASDWGPNLTAPKYLINLRGATHSYGTQFLTARGLRVEPKNNNCGLLYSQWSDGNVDIQVDWSSQVGLYQYGDIVSIDTGNTPGAIYNIHDSYLAGGVKVAYQTSSFQNQQSINFENCTWKHRMSPSEVVSYVDPATGNKVRPAVRFNNCRGADHQNPFSTNGASVWDATVGFNRGPLVKTQSRRTVMVRANRGTLQDSDGTMKVNLPVGAMITGMSAVAPPNASGDTDGGTWTVATSETTPTTVATVTLTGAMNTGYDQRTALPVPFHCNTRERATITVKATGVGFPQEDAFLTVEGYW